MKKLFSCLVICTMVLCISNVSYGSDVASFEKTYPSIENVVNFEVPAVSVEFDHSVIVTDVDSFMTTDIDLISPLETTIVKWSPPITDVGSYNYNNDLCFAYLDELDKPGSNTGYPSNHVGKLNKTVITLILTSLENRYPKRE